MMEDPRLFLARQILTEDQIVTYRLLSRSFNLHVNKAKEILYEFHELQNAKKARSVYATYLVYGTKKQAVKVEAQDDDVEMTDSQKEEDGSVPFSDEVPTYALSLVNEGQLQDLLAEYDKVTSIHIYSLAPHPVEDLQLLGDIGRQVMDMSTDGTVPAVSKEFGSVLNPDVHRRERDGQALGPAPNAPAPMAEPKSQSQQDAKPAVMNEEPKAASQPNPKAPASSAPTKKPAATAPLKRQSSSGGIGQMFARAAANPKKPAAKSTASASSSFTASATEEDQKMALSDDGEDDVEPMPKAEQESSSARQSRKDRQAELHRMMEESDEDEPEKADSPEEELIEEPPPSEPEPKAEEPAEVVSSTGDGRRRGKRRVTRKKQVMDDKGYLVTIQEQGWESFSEEEAPPSSKPKSQPVKSEPAAKSTKAAGKAQGNIMSFFSKK